VNVYYIYVLFIYPRCYCLYDEDRTTSLSLAGDDASAEAGASWPITCIM